MFYISRFRVNGEYRFYFDYDECGITDINDYNCKIEFMTESEDEVIDNYINNPMKPYPQFRERSKSNKLLGLWETEQQSSVKYKLENKLLELWETYKDLL